MFLGPARSDSRAESSQVSVEVGPLGVPRSAPQLAHVPRWCCAASLRLGSRPSGHQTHLRRRRVPPAASRHRRRGSDMLPLEPEPRGVRIGRLGRSRPAAWKGLRLGSGTEGMAKPYGVDGSTVWPRCRSSSLSKVASLREVAAGLHVLPGVPASRPRLRCHLAGARARSGVPRRDRRWTAVFAEARRPRLRRRGVRRRGALAVKGSAQYGRLRGRWWSSGVAAETPTKCSSETPTESGPALAFGCLTNRGPTRERRPPDQRDWLTRTQFHVKQELSQQRRTRPSA
jgi:hypothetical protein